MSDRSPATNQSTTTRTMLRERPERAPAAVLVAANDRLQDVRSMLATAVTPTDTRACPPTDD